MALPLIGGLIRGGAALLGGLAKAGVIRGSAGKLLGGGARAAGTAITGPVSTIGGGIGAVAPGTIGKILRSGAGQVAVGTIAGSAVLGAARRLRKDGKPYKRRTMNPTNPRALRRALSRVERFEKLVKRSFIVKDIRARKRSCR